VPTWRFEIPAGSHLLLVSSRSPYEKVASIGRVLGDRSVLYKYLNPHLLVVVIANPKQLSLTIYLLDNVSGQILHELKHTGVDTSKGVETHIVENVVYWSFFTNGHAAGQSRGGRITVAELYESREKNERFNTYIISVRC
jgi:ER membrane protein complex subunit 1